MKPNSLRIPMCNFLRLLAVTILLAGTLSTRPTGSVDADGLVIYVKANAASGGDGTSWANALNSLQSALSLATSGDQIWVAAGIYYPSDTMNQSASFSLINGVGIYGGFTGTEILLSQRNPKLNVTILSGDLGVAADFSDNSYHVVNGSNTNSTAVLDGFTISGGNALNVPDEDIEDAQFGGGMFNESGSPILSNVVFSGNRALYGGGMYNTASSPIITNTTFNGNYASERAGGLYNTSGSNTELTNVTFVKNTALNRGGGMTAAGSNPKLTNVTFTGNISNFGGAMHHAEGANSTSTNVTFYGNTATLGSTMYNEASNVSITNSILYNNGGSEIYNVNSTTAVTYSIVKDGYTGTGNRDVDPLLGPLQNNGGYTRTMLPLANSQAIDNGTDIVCPTKDQRGLDRPQGVHCDIGAVEVDFAPIVNNVTSISENGLYELGDTVTITVKFNEIVVVTGTPQIALETGATDRAAFYAGGTNTNTLQFIYTVQAYDTSPDLDYVSTSALTTNGGRIKDVSGNNANQTLPQPGTAGSLGANKDIVIDGTPPSLDVLIAGDVMGNYYVPVNTGQRVTYTEENDGPVAIRYEDPNPIVASQRVIYRSVSYSEMMGLPFEQLSKEYLFPYYNNSAMSSQLRVSNLGDVPTTINVYLGNDLLDSYELASGAAQRKSYPNANSGPLRVTSSVTEILTTIRVLYGSKSYSELMGYPVEELSQEYWYPVYDNVNVNSQLRVSNVGTGQTHITVYLGTQQIDEYDLLSGEASRKTYPYNNGPLHVVSSTEPILSTIRLLYQNKSLAELTGLPKEQLGQTFLYPAYDNVTLKSQMRVANVGDGPTIISVYAAGQLLESFTLDAGKARKRSYAPNTGPLEVVSSSQPIVSTVRMLYKTATFNSLYEMMGLPDTELSTQYFFPWYNNVAMQSELRFAVP